MIALLLSAAAVAASMGAGVAVPTVDPDHPPEELRGVSTKWLRNSLRSNLEEAQLVIAAYDLPEDVMPAFWHVFYVKLADEYQYEMSYYESIRPDTPPDEALEKLNAFVADMPMGPDKLCDMVELLLEPGDHSLERVRFAELRARRDGLVWLKEDAGLRAANLRRRIKRHRLSQADLSPDDKPMPPWAHARLKLEAERKAEEAERAREALIAAERRLASRDPMGSAGRRAVDAARPAGTLTPALSLEGEGGKAKADGGKEGETKSDGRRGQTDADGDAAGPLVAPHEDATYQSWRAALRSCLARPGLSDADRQSARALFDAWWSKARAYRRGHAADYEGLASLTSRKAFRARLLALDKSLAGLSAEFRLRLAAIGPGPVRKTTASSP